MSTDFVVNRICICRVTWNCVFSPFKKNLSGILENWLICQMKTSSRIDINSSRGNLSLAPGYIVPQLLRYWRTYGTKPQDLMIIGTNSTDWFQLKIISFWRKHIGSYFIWKKKSLKSFSSILKYWLLIAQFHNLIDVKLFNFCLVFKMSKKCKLIKYLLQTLLDKII